MSSLSVQQLVQYPESSMSTVMRIYIVLLDTTLRIFGGKSPVLDGT